MQPAPAPQGKSLPREQALLLWFNHSQSQNPDCGISILHTTNAHRHQLICVASLQALCLLRLHFCTALVSFTISNSITS
eukprot:3230370-Amphidinium_carterae.1